MAGFEFNKSKFSLQIKSPLSLWKANDYLDAIRLHCKLLPEYMPIKWGWTEPLKHIFDIDHLEEFILTNGNTDWAWWKCSGKVRALGSWKPRHKIGNNLVPNHSGIYLDVYKTVYQEKLINYLKAASQRFEADIGYIDSNIDHRKIIKEFNYYREGRLVVQKAICGDIELHLINHWLSNMPWAVVFGPPYVRMFGKERVLSTPAYKVEDIGDELIFIQLTSDINDTTDNYEIVRTAREAAKKHLGEDCFLQVNLAYDRTLELEKAGKVFRVPIFEMKPD